MVRCVNKTYTQKEIDKIEFMGKKNIEENIWSTNRTFKLESYKTKSRIN